MALIALLSARDSARERTAAGASGALIEFGGQSLVEFQARMAIAAGADHILIQIDSITPELAQLVDRLMAERQASVALVQDMASLARSVVPDDRLLLIAESLIVPSEALVSLINGGMPAILALPAVPATTSFERIDGESVWAGGLFLPGGAVLATIDMLGEWDLGLTLLRRAVQDGAHRVTLSPELVMDGRLGLLRDQQSADLALQVLAEQGQSTAGDDRTTGLGRLLMPIARPLVRELVRRQIEPTRLATIAFVLCTAGLALGVGNFSVLAVLVMLAGQALSDLARQSADVTLRAAAPPSRHRIVQAMGLALLAVIGWRLSQGNILALSGAWLPLFFTGLLCFVPERGDAAAGLWSQWFQISVSLALVIVLPGLLFGVAGAAFALLGAMTAAIVSLRILPKPVVI